ncbi:MAG: lipid-binding SYLF domain-containing protein [Candidatus Aminicenantes bacterium]|nr:lipid-binding SYLF domain-containing protein [Candidatus Aminicenantes bacterium]
MRRTVHRKISAGLVLSLAAVLLAPSWGAAPTSDANEEERRVGEAIRVFQEIAELTEEGIPESILCQAYGIAIIPGMVKAAYGIGGEYGRGVLLVKDRSLWSNPSFITLAGGSLGWQVGIQKSDLLLVFKTRRSIDNIADGKITLGADAGVAAGPVGRGAQATTDLEMKAEIYAYSKSKGLFIGISLKGAAIQIDSQSNRDYYGNPDISARDIFENPDLRAPGTAKRLRRVLSRHIGREFGL